VSGEDFFSRWSRRKREVRQTESVEPRPPETTDEAPGAVEPVADAGTAQTASPEPELSPEEIENLPSLDALTPETDLSVFFRKGVPQALRNAAMRRMWSLDPTIRDYVGDARDYAWDWNIPGDVPGYGPLAPTDEIYATLDQMFSPRQTAEADREHGDDHAFVSGQSVASPDNEAPAQETEPAAPNADASNSRALQQGSQEPSPHVAGANAENTATNEIPFDAQLSNAAASQQPQPELVPARPRRHGGAAPH
jgi:hypothetical protein